MSTSKPDVHLLQPDNACNLTLLRLLQAEGACCLSIYTSVQEMRPIRWGDKKQDGQILVLESEWLDDPEPLVVVEEGNKASEVLAFLQVRLGLRRQMVPQPQLPMMAFAGGVLLLSNRRINLYQIDDSPDLIVDVLETPVKKGTLAKRLLTLWYRVNTHRRLQEEIFRRTRVLMETLAGAIEQRDQTTGHHVQRVAALSRLLAERYYQTIGKRYSEADLDQLALAAALHDVGKIATPESILNKPGKLNNAEDTDMKKHAQKGHDLLSDTAIEVMNLAAVIAQQHHERYGGGGYPGGLCGERIRKESQIVAIIDVMDALLAERPYKKGLPKDDAYRIITEENKNHYDPVLLNVFKSYWPELYREFLQHTPPVSSACNLFHC
ncbi:MAG: HD domain-containing protein [Magnetococcales bacterium]|nr:HD domain-containing protein [Magnetococcales bacterium]